MNEVQFHTSCYRSHVSIAEVLLLLPSVIQHVLLHALLYLQQ